MNSLLQHSIELVQPNQARPEFFPGDVIGGEFEVEAPFKETGNSHLLLASPVKCSGAAVIKMPKEACEEVFQRFAREAVVTEAMEEFGAPKVLSTGLVDENSQWPYMALEHLGPGNLGDQKNLSLPEKLSVLADAFDGAEGLHGLGFAHRDIKRVNIYVTEGRRGCLADFGIVKPIGEGSQVLSHDDLNTEFLLRESLTETGAVPNFAATLAYTPLDIIEGAPASKADDVFSAGVTACITLTDQHPWLGDIADAPQNLSLKEYAQIIEHRPNVDPSLLPESGSLRKIIVATLSEDPDDRPEMAEMAAEFRSAAMCI